MCTVTFMPRKRGYALLMNRDEQRSRVAALPPSRRKLGSREVIYPCEPAGGAWIGVNDAGVTLALINWYSVSSSACPDPASRGEVTLAALQGDSASAVAELLTEAMLRRVRPFRLIGVFPRNRTAVEWRWDQAHLAVVAHAWETGLWVSSGFDEAVATRERRGTFNAALGQRSRGRLEWLRRLHRSHAPERGAFSICMHRDDAVTVSSTEVILEGAAASMRYTPGPPCCTDPLPERGLRWQ